MKLRKGSVQKLSESNVYSNMDPVEQLKVYQNKYCEEESERGIIANALGKVLPKYERLKYINVVPYKTGSSDHDAIDMVAIYDTRKVTDEELRTFLCLNDAYHSYIVTMNREQWDHLFL